MGIVSPIEKRESLPSSLLDNGREKSVLKRSEINRTLNLNVMNTKGLVPQSNGNTPLEELLGQNNPIVQYPK